MIFGAFLALAWGEIFRLFDIPKCSGHFQVFRLNKNTIVGNISGHWLDVTDYSWGPGVSPLEIIPNPSDFIVRDGMLSYPLDSTEAIQALRGWLEKSKTLLARPPKKWQYWTYYALPLPLILLYIGAIIYFAH